MPYDFDESNPADDAVVSQYPANERNQRTNVKGAYTEEHDEGSGHHAILAGNDAARDAITDWVEGSIWWNTEGITPKLQRQKNPSTPFDWTEFVGQEFDSGVRMVFDLDTAPSGWTRDAVIDDKVIRIVKDARADAGSWTISGLTPWIAGHTLTVSEIPSHTHGIHIGIGLAGAANYPVAPGYNYALLAQSEGAGGGGSHGHTGSTISSDASWRPAHRDMILAEKD